MELIVGKVAGAGNFALDDVLRHGTSVETRTGRDSVRGSEGGMESLAKAVALPKRGGAELVVG
jgi:hypothetical protein